MPIQPLVRPPDAPSGPGGVRRAPWRVRGWSAELERDIARRHGLSPVVARLCAARGWSDADALERHLVPRRTQLADPFLLPGMQTACERVLRALARGETILVHGDYDVDGVTGTALLVRLLRLLGARVEWHIPNRFTDGYSFGAHSVARAEATGATLVISVDNGTSAGDVIGELARRGIDTIVTDHHEPPLGDLPVAVAIVNPKLAGSTYPFRELCGGAVAFKLAWGVAKAVTGAERVKPELAAFLVDAMAYVAIATVCDVVPLVEENRVFARYGLESLAASCDPGLVALREVAGFRNGGALSAEDVAFQIGPRINAMGRLGSAGRAVELLLGSDLSRTRALAAELDRANLERRRIEGELLAQALVAAEPFADAVLHPMLVVAGRGWHQGVVGIIAARLAERFARPTLVIGLDENGRGRGSARSIAGVDLLGLLHAGAPHMTRYGGHEQAAGCEVVEDALPALRAALCERARDVFARGLPETPLWIDAEVDFAACDETLARELDRLRPYGERNEKPVLCSRDVRLAEPARVVGKTAEHLVLTVRSGAHVLRGVAFKKASRAGELAMGTPLDVVYSPRWNTFRGETKLELEVLDFAARA